MNTRVQLTPSAYQAILIHTGIDTEFEMKGILVGRVWNRFDIMDVLSLGRRK